MFTKIVTVDTIRLENSFLTHPGVIFSIPLGETPFARDDDLIQWRLEEKVSCRPLVRLNTHTFVTLGSGSVHNATRNLPFGDLET